MFSRGETVHKQAGLVQDEILRKIAYRGYRAPEAGVKYA